MLRAIIALSCAGLLLAHDAGAQFVSSGIVRRIPLNASGIYPSNVAAAPTLEVDFSQAPPGVGNTFTANTGQTLTQKGSGITRTTDGTYPAGVSGSQGHEWNFNGSTDYITSTIGPPAGDFSVMCVVTPSALTSNAIIIGNYRSPTSQRGWSLGQGAASTSFVLSDDGTSSGGHLSSLYLPNSLSIGRTSVIVSTYDYVADGSSIMSLYVDKMTPATKTDADGPVYSNAENISIAADGSGGGALFAGTISHCAYWDGIVLTPGQAAAILNTWLGVLSTSGVPVSTTAATPPALQVAAGDSGTEPFLRSFGANLNTISNNGSCSGLYGATATTNKVWRGSLETWAAGVPTGWTETITSTGDCAQTTASKAHLYSSARCVLVDADDAVSLTSGCATVSGNTGYQISAWAKSVSGTPLLTVTVIEDDSADCGSPTTTTDVISGATPTTSWGIQRGTITTQAATIRAQVRVTLPAAAAQVMDIDAVMMRGPPGNGYITDAYCATDADSDAACSTTVNSTPSPYSANGPTTTTLTACTPYAGTALIAESSVAFADGNSSAANSLAIAVINATTDEPMYWIWDNSPNYKYVSPDISNWSALTSYALKYGHDGSGNLRLWWNSAWQTTMGGAGTGKRSAAQTTTYLGGTNSLGHDVYVRDIVVFRRVIP